MAELCRVFSRCGGCPQITVSPERQRRAKLDAVKLALGKGAEGLPLAFSPVSSELGYRNRIRLRVTDAGHLAFFNPAKENGCVVLCPELWEWLGRIRQELSSASSLLTTFSHAELRAPDLDGRPGLLLSAREGKSSKEQFEAALQRLSAALPPEVLLDLRWKEQNESGRELRTLSEGDVTQRFAITRDVYQRVPLDGFMQVNSAVNGALVTTTVELARTLGVRRALDLYCGSGNFALALAAAHIDVEGIELNPSSVRAATRAAAEQGLSARFHAGSAPDWLDRRRGAPRPQLAVADPPRAGLGPGAEQLIAWGTPHLVICSCNPRTLALDLSRLHAAGYALRSVELFDMFPHTDHVEVLAHLAKA